MIQTDLLGFIIFLKQQKRHFILLQQFKIKMQRNLLLPCIILKLLFNTHLLVILKHLYQITVTTFQFPFTTHQLALRFSNYNFIAITIYNYHFRNNLPLVIQHFTIRKMHWTFANFTKLSICVQHLTFKLCIGKLTFSI